MFKEARLKLTGWYLLIIMTISLSFSAVIYVGANNELVRMDMVQKERQARIDNIKNYLLQNQLPVPPEIPGVESETLEQLRLRVITNLGIINLLILALSGVGGYFLAGQTLKPVSKMVKDQKDFIGNASHELRTPITSLKTEIEVALRDKKMTLAEAKKLLKSNLEDVNNMQRLSNYLLEFSRYDDPNKKPEIKKIELSSVVDSAIDNLVPVAAAKNIKIIKKLNKSHVKSEEGAVTRLSTIFIDNAIKYSKENSEVEVSVKGNGVLEVADHGMGISDTDLPHIFDRFYRADSSHCKNTIDGYGLGLSIAKSIADSTGAKIKVQSKLGKGSTFSVQFQT